MISSSGFARPTSMFVPGSSWSPTPTAGTRRRAATPTSPRSRPRFCSIGCGRSAQQPEKTRQARRRRLLGDREGERVVQGGVAAAEDEVADGVKLAGDAGADEAGIN